jgi:hypothetical protein
LQGPAFLLSKIGNWFAPRPSSCVCTQARHAPEHIHKLARAGIA